MKKCAALLTFLLAAGCALDPTKIVGQVVDEADQPLVEAQVQVAGSGIVAMTDVNGRFEIDATGLRDEFSLKFSLEGYGSVWRHGAIASNATQEFVAKLPRHNFRPFVVPGPGDDALDIREKTVTVRIPAATLERPDGTLAEGKAMASIIVVSPADRKAGVLTSGSVDEAKSLLSGVMILFEQDGVALEPRHELLHLIFDLPTVDELTELELADAPSNVDEMKSFYHSVFDGQNLGGVDPTTGSHVEDGPLFYDETANTVEVDLEPMWTIAQCVYVPPPPPNAYVRVKAQDAFGRGISGMVTFTARGLSGVRTAPDSVSVRGGTTITTTTPNILIDGVSDQTVERSSFGFGTSHSWQDAQFNYCIPTNKKCQFDSIPGVGRCCSGLSCSDRFCQ